MPTRRTRTGGEPDTGPDETAPSDQGTLGDLDVHSGHRFDGDPTVDAEIAVLAAVLNDAECFYDLADRVSADHFSSPARQALWAAFAACDSQGRGIDVITVADELRRRSMLDRVGGVAFLERVKAAANATPGLLGDHADLVIDQALRRRVAAAAREIASQAAQPGVEGRDALAYAEKTVFGIGSERATSTMLPVAQIVPEVIQNLMGARSSLLLGHSTGLRELDKLTAGAQPGQLIVIAARPGMGKSALALSIGRHIAESTGDMVLFASYEMSRHELLTRLLAASMNCDLHLFRQGILPEEMEDELTRHAQKLQALPIIIDDDPPDTIAGLRAACRRLSRRGALAAIMVDYLQLMSGERRGRDENRATEISEISRGLKRLARELKVPVFALSQLNRQVEQRPNKRPMLSDLRESGSIEQDADTVWFLYREAVYRDDADRSAAELAVGKQRNGPTGRIPLVFRAESASYVDAPEGARLGGDDEPGGAGSAPFGGGRRGRAPF
jgi:replicative DNA helicase